MATGTQQGRGDVSRHSLLSSQDFRNVPFPPVTLLSFLLGPSEKEPPTPARQGTATSPAAPGWGPSSSSLRFSIPADESIHFMFVLQLSCSSHSCPSKFLASWGFPAIPQALALAPLVKPLAITFCCAARTRTPEPPI